MQHVKTFSPSRVKDELINKGLAGLNEEINKIARIINRFPWVDVQDYREPNAFSKAIDKIGSSNKTLIISNQQNVIDDKTVPSNIELKFLRSGSLNVSADKTVTINGYLEAGLYQIFEGDGSVVLGPSAVKEVYPEWWGS